MPIEINKRKKRGPMSQEQKDKISASKKLNPTRYWLGKERSQSTKEAISKAGKGRKHTDETKEKFRGRKAWNKGFIGYQAGKNSPHWKGGLPNCTNCERKLTNYKRITQLCTKCFNKQNFQKENNPNWKGGISVITKTERQLAMETTDYKDWRKSVFERDDYTCIDCGNKNCKLNAHHIKSWLEYPNNRYDIDNGATLCIDCHKRVHKHKKLQ